MLFQKALSKPFRLCRRTGARRNLLRTFWRVGTFVLVLSLALQYLLAYHLKDDSRLLPSTLQEAKNLLLVTAHPDDECLFFSPTVLGLLGKYSKTKGGLLVMSTGISFSCILPPPRISSLTDSRRSQAIITALVRHASRN